MKNKQINTINIAIDADSLIFKACYRHQIPNGGGVNIEQAYLEFCFEIGKIKSAVFRIRKYQAGDVVRPLIVLSPKTTFRNHLSDEYKANRKPPSIHGIKQLKLMVMHRLKDWAQVLHEVEADDVVIYFARNHDYLVSAIDKDVIMACPTYCYDYNNRRWEYPRLEYEIETWYARQALMGDGIDGIKGAQDVGEVRSLAWVSKFENEPFSWSGFVDMFGDEHVAELAMNLVRMDGLRKIDGKMVWKPWTVSGNNYWEY